MPIILLNVSMLGQREYYSANWPNCAYLSKFFQGLLRTKLSQLLHTVFLHRILSNLLPAKHQTCDSINSAHLIGWRSCDTHNFSSKVSAVIQSGSPVQ